MWLIAWEIAPHSRVSTPSDMQQRNKYKYEYSVKLSKLAFFEVLLSYKHYCMTQCFTDIVLISVQRQHTNDKLCEFCSLV